MPFLLLYWKWFAAAALILALVGVYNVHVDGLLKAREVKATTTCVASFQAAEEAGIAKAQAEAAATEAAHQKDLQAIADKHAKDLANAKLKAKAQHDKDMADALSGRISLRVPVATCSDSAGLQASASGGNSASGATIELPRQITSDLYGLANDADSRVSDLILKLDACYQIVASDRKVFPTTGAKP